MTAGHPDGGAGWGGGSDAYAYPEVYPDVYADPYATGLPDAHGDPDPYATAVGALDDPLNDPLPGGRYPEEQQAYAPEHHAAHDEYDPETVGLRRPADLNTGGRHAQGEADTTALRTTEPAPSPGPGRAARRRAANATEPAPAEGRAARRKAAAAAEPAPTEGRAARRRAANATEPAPAEGRAARRKAAAAGGPPAAAEAAGGGRAARRKAAKTAAKAAKQTGTAISNVIGELFITTGVLLLLFVVYQLWWTNVQARAHANDEADRLTEQWDGNGSGGAGGEENRDPGTFSAGEGFAILYIPSLDVRVPIAETVNPENVLDKGMVGHYSEEDRLPTAMPWDEEGNFGIAGHRNTHAEPFRYINRLEPGDPIVVETEDTFYTYEMASRLDSTSPSNTAVLDPVPDQGGFTEPGRYITLTTCTPEFTSTYRLIVWGQMVEERPRSEGKPDALVN
ncbi:class E sortase [Streptomyces sp. MP131-18]|uniref:class E sortase n=1 Tax=Streptomyces sp. MP131-18 TaxID=1857892 RepID=UPI0009C8E358|nr:class E sortase [Streptomyces sp. MP131-18]ONK12782.1 sortase [Streptomyces sp. MP131-18]